MALEDVKEVMTTDNVSKMNAYLKAGWILLAVNPAKMEDGAPWTWYSLGWPSTDTPAYPDYPR